MCLKRTECSLVRVDQRLAEIDCADHDLIIFVCSHLLSLLDCCLSLSFQLFSVAHSLEKILTLFFCFCLLVMILNGSFCPFNHIKQLLLTDPLVLLFSLSFGFPSYHYMGFKALSVTSFHFKLFSLPGRMSIPRSSRCN